MLQFYLSLIQDPEDQDKFKVIYDIHRPRMTKIAYHLVQVQHDVEEALQEAFVSIARNIDKLADPKSTNVRIYIDKTIKSSCYNILRKRQELTELVNLDECQEIDSNEDLEKDAATKDLYRRVLRYIQTMPAQYVDALTLHIANDMSVKEIAISLHRSTNTIYTWLRRGQAMIIEHFPEVQAYGKIKK
ncbi:MAG: sigma-70 family RNA polymerase sigma factor [Clostridia bacterium]|nr:sigma-70 family RNA polymerase sigma factor [Clostridia bacterium]